MNTLMQGFLDNDSFFGRFMTKLGIIIAANIMFVLLSIPFFTIGAGLSALYYVMFRTLRNDGVVNPFKEFMTGLKLNFRGRYPNLQCSRRRTGLLENRCIRHWCFGTYHILIFDPRDGCF